ncbi:minor capsid protein [Streptomyces sp. NPDC005395]|uniref:minor capsid protein n=1 Tax=Streptomyces sp. NPDC005395 TaxID=3157042 RepID=UPI0033A5A2C2
MADLDPTDGIAQYLDGLGLVEYDPTGRTGDLFVERMPADPAAAVCLSLYDAGAPDARNAYDTVRLQVRVRGGPDPRVSRGRAWVIYRALHGLAAVELPDGTWLILAAARGTPGPMGADAQGRHEHVVNFNLDVSSPSTHRSE